MGRVLFLGALALAACGGARPAVSPTVASPAPVSVVDLAPAPAATDPPRTDPPRTDPPRFLCMDCGQYDLSISVVVLFAVGSATIPGTSGSALRDVVTLMAGRKDLRIQVEGHADPIEPDVSLRRAEAVRKRLVAEGADPARLSVIARGATRPMNSNETAAGRARNRRVQFIPQRDESP